MHTLHQSIIMFVLPEAGSRVPRIMNFTDFRIEEKKKAAAVITVRQYFKKYLGVIGISMGFSKVSEHTFKKGRVKKSPPFFIVNYWHFAGVGESAA